jgi:hypothetical protein
MSYSESRVVNNRCKCLEYKKTVYNSYSYRSSTCLKYGVKTGNDSDFSWWITVNILAYIVQIGWWALMHKTVTNENKMCHGAFYGLSSVAIGIPTAIVFFSSLDEAGGLWIVSFIIRFIPTIPCAMFTVLMV